MNFMSLSRAFEIWKESALPVIVKVFGEDDYTAKEESWSAFTDGLCSDGQLSDLQYHFCPSHDEEMPEDDFEFVLDAMGISYELFKRDDVYDVTVHHGEKTARFVMQHPYEYTPDAEDIIQAFFEDEEANADLFFNKEADKLRDFFDI